MPYPRTNLVVAVATEFDERDSARMSTTFGRETAASMVEIAIALLGE